MKAKCRKCEWFDNSITNFCEIKLKEVDPDGRVPEECTKFEPKQEKTGAQISLF